MMINDIVTVSPNELTPTHDISLTDKDGTKLGFITSDKRGMVVPNLIAVTDAEKTGLQTTVGVPSLTDTLYPYITQVQSDWSGGLGNGLFEDDTTRFKYSSMLDTTGNGLQTIGLPMFANIYNGTSPNEYAIHKSENVPSNEEYDYYTPPDTVSHERGVLIAKDDWENVYFDQIVINIRINGEDTTGQFIVHVYNDAEFIPDNLVDISSIVTVASFNERSEYVRFVFTSIMHPDVDETYYIVLKYYGGTADFSILSASHAMMSGYYFDGTIWVISSYHLLLFCMNTYGNLTYSPEILSKTYKDTNCGFTYILYIFYDLINYPILYYLAYGDAHILYTFDFKEEPLSMEVVNDIVYITWVNESVTIFKIYAQDDGSLYCTKFDISVDADYCKQVGNYIWYAKNRVNNIHEVWKDELHGYGDYPGSGITTYDCKSALDEKAIANITSTFEDIGYAKIAVADAFTTGLAACKAITSTNIKYSNILHFEYMTTLDCAANDLAILLDDTAQCASPVATIGLPASVANVPQTVDITFDASTLTGIDKIISVGLKIQVDKGQMDIYIMSPIVFYKDNKPIRINNDHNITGIEMYDVPPTLYIFSENQVGYIIGDIAYEALPLKEMNSVASIANGTLHITNDIYLYFNVGNGIMRYYKQMLAHIGPNINNAFPYKYFTTSFITGMPGGRLLLVAHISDETNNSGYEYDVLLLYENNAWVELIRSEHISNIHIITDPAEYSLSDIYLFTDKGLFYFPMGMNQMTSYGLIHATFGSIILGSFTTRLYGIDKFWNTLKLVFSDMDIEGDVKAYYRLEPLPKYDYFTNKLWSDWDYIGSYTQSGTEKNLSTADIPDTISDKLDIRLELHNTDMRIPIIINNVILEAFGMIKPKRLFYFNFLIGDIANETDKNGNIIQSALSERLAKLLTWKNNPQPLRMHTNINSMDNILVQILSFSYRSYETSTMVLPGEGHEKLLCEISLVEL